MLLILFRPSILAAKQVNAASLRFRTHGKIYWPGSGLRTKQEIEEEAKCKKEGKWPKEHPFEYTIFGTKRITHDHRFHYTDRKAGKGYTDFSDAHYQDRPYIWPGIRSVTKYYLALFVFLGIPLTVDHKWFLYHGSKFYNKYFKSDAATIETEKDEEKNKSDGQNDKSGSSVVDIPFDQDNELMVFLFIAGIIAIIITFIINLT